MSASHQAEGVDLCLQRPLSHKTRLAFEEDFADNRKLRNIHPTPSLAMMSLAHLRAVHWRTPTVIISTFIAGLVFAISHHLFYNHLDGQPVGNDHLFNQQINLAVGQAFAFLVRASLVIAVGASYWQVFWVTVLQDTFTLSQIDALAGILGSTLDLLNFRASRSRPVLVALALLSWMIPLASILPPATLSVQSTTRGFSTYAHVPIPRFSDATMVNTLLVTIPFTTENKPNYTYSTRYQNPTRQLARLVTSSAYGGAVPDHQTQHSNSTYDPTSRGPL